MVFLRCLYLMLIVSLFGCDNNSSSFFIDSTVNVECNTHSECPRYEYCIAQVCKFPKNYDYSSLLARITVPFNPPLSYFETVEIPSGVSEHEPDITIKTPLPILFNGKIVQNESGLLLSSQLIISVEQTITPQGFSNIIHHIAKDGKFSLTLLRSFKYRFIVTPDDISLPEENFAITLTSTHPDSYEHSFFYPSLNELTTIKGKVKPPKGIPIYDVTGLSVSGTDGKMNTSLGSIDNNREFSLKTHYRPEILTLTISGNDQIRNFPVFTVPYSVKTSKVIDLPSFNKCNFGKITGSVKGRTSSYQTMPIPYTELQFSTFLSTNAKYQVIVNTDSEGNYQTNEFTQKLYPGNYHVTVIPRPDSPFLSQVFSIIIENSLPEKNDCETLKFEKIQHFVLLHGTKVSGTIVNSEGFPISYAGITAISLASIETKENILMYPKTAFSDAMGFYTLFLSKGDYQLEIRPPSSLDFPVHQQSLSLSSLSELEIPAFTVLPPTYLISSLHDHENQPFSGVGIELFRFSFDDSNAHQPISLGKSETNQNGYAVIPVTRLITSTNVHQ